MKKAASIVSLVLLWVFGTGCESQGTRAQIHVRVFEVPAQVLRLHTSSQSPRKLSDSAYCVSVVTPENLDALLQYNGTAQRLLAERTRVIEDWPAIADTWVYASSYAGRGADCLYTGGGVGSLGVRERGGNLQVRLDYMVNHRGPQGQRLIDSEIFYDHDYPEGQVLLFHAPLDAEDGSSERHVIAFEIERARPAPTYAPPEVLAYR